MDWYLDRPEEIAAVRHELVAYLTRHAVSGSDAGIADAELISSEAMGNALRHTAGPTWVSLSWGGEHPVLSVYDLGEGFDPDLLVAASEPDPGHAGLDDEDEFRESGRGLLIMRTLSPEARASVRAGGGMLFQTPLPVRRQPTVSHDPPRRRTGVLPSPDEAEPGGGFGKEAFLRAIVVQLAQAVEGQQGPQAAEAAVAQVGMDVGGQMEAEFRAATDTVGRMTPEQMGTCYVRLKHAIDGRFSVVEAGPDRIVLENRACPFGEAVLRAPALCRMTSSVFGGIAARNSPAGASVVLEERIALGDPGCRVTVHLGPPPPESVPFAHRYGGSEA
ncbi:methanogen output domain 1-containing protein [Phycicoccus duodecadis]|uniref:methanogen output domain 1-containing protein n=1 Tax=Phycicoccus duodecadis TaxID=173053 RepID=UPI0013040F4F|nr:methanogen output domain 1-containing protein [Phycicoccus duodecadis]